MRDSTPNVRRRWSLDQESFDAFLMALDPDRARAGERYELLRQKLVRFFEWRGAFDAEEHADETLNRVVRRIVEGEPVRDIPKYAAGVARMVWRESLKQRDRSKELDERTLAAEPEPQEDVDPVHVECLDACLASLPDDQRALLLEYFAEEKGAKIDNRKQMAARLGVEMNALRIRIHRIRSKLELCVKECVSRREAG